MKDLKYIKPTYKVEWNEEQIKAFDAVFLSRWGRIKKSIQIFFMSFKYACEQIRELYNLKRKLQSGEIIGEIVQKPKKK